MLPGDIVFLTSDGISDNFDPVVGKFCIPRKPERNHQSSRFSLYLGGKYRLLITAVVRAGAIRVHLYDMYLMFYITYVIDEQFFVQPSGQST